MFHINFLFSDSIFFKYPTLGHHPVPAELWLPKMDYNSHDSAEYIHAFLILRLLPEGIFEEEAGREWKSPPC